MMMIPTCWFDENGLALWYHCNLVIKSKYVFGVNDTFLFMPLFKILQIEINFLVFQFHEISIFIFW